MVQALDIRAELPKTPVGKLSKKELYEEEEKKRAAKACCAAAKQRRRPAHARPSLDEPMPAAFARRAPGFRHPSAPVQVR